MISFRELLAEAGSPSIRTLADTTGAATRSVTEQLQIGAIGNYYVRTGGIRGPLGIGLKDVAFDTDDGSAQRRYAGGSIHVLNNTPQGHGDTVVRVRYVGFHCNAESDELSDSDEPYFIVAVASSQKSRTTKFGPYDDVDAGDDFSATDLVVREEDMMVPPIAIGVVGMEHDEGTPEEAEAKVRKIFEAVEEKIDQAAGAIGAYGGENHVMPEWMRDIVIGWGPEGVAALFGLGDDLIATESRVLFDYDAALDEWRAPATLGTHKGNRYNYTVRINQQNGDEGDYTLFFDIDLFSNDITILPRP